MSHAQCGEDQKLKIDILVLKDIPRNLHGHTNKQNCFGVIYKTTRIHSERILEVSSDNLHTERNELALLSGNLFPSLIISCCYGPRHSPVTY